MSSHGASKQTLHLPPASWPRRVSLEKGRALIGRGMKGGDNRVIKEYVLIGSHRIYPR